MGIHKVAACPASRCEFLSLPAAKIFQGLVLPPETTVFPGVAVAEGKLTDALNGAPPTGKRLFTESYKRKAAGVIRRLGRAFKARLHLFSGRSPPL